MRYNDTYEQENLIGRRNVTPVKNYSSYWLDFDDDDKDVTVQDNSYTTERIVKLASVRRAVANFVRILTNKENIKVEFSSGQQSYTDGKNVVIAAEDDSKHFDSMVGLALHEGSHCVLSDFNFLKNMMTDNSKFVLGLKSELRDMLGTKIDETYWTKANSMQKHISFIMNVIEDRRIDSFMYTTAIGYRPYYDAMYKKYFFNAEVTKNLKYNPDWRKPTVENYVDWLINLFHPDFDRNALPGLSKMVDMIDLANIRRFDSDKQMPEDFSKWTFSQDNAPWYPVSVDGYTHPFNKLLDYNKLPQLWKVANDIFYAIIQHVASYELQQKKQESSGNQPVFVEMDGNGFEVDPNGLENLDMNQNVVEVPKKKNMKVNSKKMKDAMKKIKNVMEGKNRRKKLLRKEKNDIQHLENADAKIVEAGDKVIGKFPCLVLRNVTRQLMESDVFPFSDMHYKYTNGGRTITRSLRASEKSTNAVIKGMQMGQILAHRLQVRNDPQVTHFTRQPQGKIDRRILAQLGMDIEQVFKRTTVENYRPAMLHLSLDASGSMNGNKWLKVISVATALAYVSSKIKNIEVVITIRGDREIPIVAVVYDSRKDRFQKARTLFPCLSPGGSTPEGLCFKATMDLITECSSEYDVYFINFSDGEPGCGVRTKDGYKSYGGDEALNHTRRQVLAMYEENVKVLSYFIDGGSSIHGTNYNISWNAFKKMYGEDAVKVNVENSVEVVRTLNKLLLRKGA